MGLSNNVSGAETSEYLALKARLAAIDIRKNLDNYSILRKVQLCFATPCNKSGNYFIPDFIAVRKITDDVTDIDSWDVIIIDTKLTQNNSGWTPNQRAAQNENEYFVKSVPDNNALVTGENIVGEFRSLVGSQTKQVQRNDNFIKAYSDGNGNFNGGGIE